MPSAGSESAAGAAAVPQEVLTMSQETVPCEFCAEKAILKLSPSEHDTDVVGGSIESTAAALTTVTVIVASPPVDVPEVVDVRTRTV